MRLLLDMNLTPRWVSFLAKDGLLRLLRQCGEELETGAIATLDCGEGFRVRFLPLK
jgi:hypothetical protein